MDKHPALLWPGARTKALTFSYDDCVLQDVRLVKLFNENGVKGTFNMNSGQFGKEGGSLRDGKYVDHSHVLAGDVAAIYDGHETAVHTVTHPHLTQLNDAQILEEILQDRRTLEELVRYPVRGMAYPYGDVNERLKELVEACGIVYSRGTKTTKRFALPVDAYDWSCTCHHRELDQFVEPFLAEGSDLRLLAVWGHSYEFDQRDDWDQIEEELKRLGHHDDVWYATNIEVFDYITAFRALRLSVDGRYAYNASAVKLCVRVENKTYEIAPGSSVEFQ